MRIFASVLITIAAFWGCAKKADVTVTKNRIITSPDTIKAMNNDTVNYLALGDSYTIGESVPQLQSFPYLLTGLLKNVGFNAKDPFIVATTGWTSANLVDAIARTTIKPDQFEFVTLLIGVNDQYQNASQDVYRTNFIQLLHTAIGYAKGDKTRVFVLSIPDYGVTPFANGQDAVIGPLIDEFNSINLDESRNAGVNYLNITGISRQAAIDGSLIAPDGLHPSGKMYAEWMQALEPMVASRLNKK